MSEQNIDGIKLPTEPNESFKIQLIYSLLIETSDYYEVVCNKCQGNEYFYCTKI